ncbi:MAG: GntR family transcriptional regulator, partial [Sinorhizobium meliloti]|nr:GntR family transcriptional regulator [Sinorhizobium meliloti]
MEISVQGQQDQSMEPSGAPSRRPRVQKDVTRAIAAEICGDD